LKGELSRYFQIAKNGGWPTITASAKSLKPDSSSPDVATLKKGLQMTGDLPGADSSQVFNDTLVMGIKNAQQRFGYTPDGKLTDAPNQRPKCISDDTFTTNIDEYGTHALDDD